MYSVGGAKTQNFSDCLPFLVDLSLAFEVREGIELFGVIDNLFDSDPPPAASAQGGTNQVFFDPIGRYYKMGARVRF